jgi:hypothetical protein
MTKNQLKKYGREILGLSPDGTAPTSVLDMLNVGKTAPKRVRSWESKRPATSYRIPAPLITTAKEAQEKILACAENDENGEPRSGMSVDIIADVILRWAIKHIKEKPGALPQSITPHTKSGSTVFAAEWKEWNGTPPIQRTPRRRNKKNQTPRFHISYRIQEKTKRDIKEIAQERGLSLGELFLYLIQFGLTGHDNGRFRIKPTDPEVTFTGADYEDAKK